MFIASVVIIVHAQKLEILPATFFSVSTALFSHLAYKFAKEKFRLDLFDKRWAVYEHALEFCSRVTQQGTLIRRKDNEEAILAALKAAENSFRGTGWHKTRALFGNDIYQLFDQINKSYAWLSSFGDQPPQHRAADWPEKMEKNLMFIWETVGKLPEIFKPYVYFGNYKQDE